MELVQKKNISDITVKDIVSNCDLSRATFYRYFKDKYDLMSWVFQDELNEILKKYPNLNGWREVTFETLNFIYNKKEYFKNTVQYRNQNSIIEHISERTNFYFISRFKYKFGENNIPKSLIKSIDFYCAGISYLLEEWIMHGMIESPETITNWLCDFIPKILLDAIN